EPSDGPEVKTTKSGKSYKDSHGGVALTSETPWLGELWQDKRVLSSAFRLPFPRKLKLELKAIYSEF
ncbi:MAG TPA: hypothetical protein VFY34_17485, partial [Pyrinomonadaceae bacterium]|nr:hypothetical protein [Pyrinomonadaceae bacterium]